MLRSTYLTFATLVFCATLAGCGATTYYKYEGPGEAKKLVIYKRGGNITIDLSPAVGGGMWKFISREEIRDGGGKVQKTIETKDGVKFTLSYDPAGVLPVSVKDVYYEGKQLEGW